MIENNNLKILIVDDTPENLLIIAKTLEPEGYEMRFSQDGMNALSIAKEVDFDLIVLDIMMPNMDGFEVCRRLKADPATTHIPVIFITAKTDIESIIKGFNIGGVDYLTKPFNINELRVRVSTHLKLRLRELELQKLNATKDKFIAIIAHELKIPLGGIKGFVTALNEQFENFSIADIRENITLVKEAIENLSALVENLLNWSNLQVGHSLYCPNKLELNSIIYEMVHLYDSYAAHKEISLNFQMQGSFWVYADIAMLEIVLRNLMSNAIKYGRKKGFVRIIVIEQEKDVLITIEDNGIGITDEKLQKLFRLDNAIKETGTNGEVGTGMGLILAKEYVERHNGRIWIKSAIEKGTQVYFTLPKASKSDNLS